MIVQHHGAYLPHITYDPAKPKLVENGTSVFYSKPSDRFRDVTTSFFEDVDGGFPFRDKHFKLAQEGKVDYRRFNDCKVCRDFRSGRFQGRRSFGEV